jgi:CHASE2 domain-containing sensor protein
VSGFGREVLVNLALGLGIAALLFAIRDLPRFKDVEDASLDWFIQIRQADVAEGAPAFAIIDVDERTYRATGQPYYTHRGNLLKLIEFALSGEPKAVIVDFDLSRPGAEADEEAALAEFIRTYRGPVPIIAIQPVIRSLEDPGAPRIHRPVALRELTRGNPHIYWGSALVTVDDDFTVRRWRVWEKSCTPDGRPEVLIPIQIIAALLIEFGAPVHDRLEAYRQKILETLPFACDGSEQVGSRRVRDTIDVAGRQVLIQPSWTESRIFYTFPWGAASGDTFVNTRHLVIRPALPILQAQSGSVANDWLKGRLVVISGSYDEGGDVHRTPLGEMPGSLVIVNSTYSLMARGQVIEPPLWQSLIFHAVAILLMSILFARFNSFWGMVFSGAIVIIAVLPLTFYGYNHGIWVNFTLPLTAVWWQRIIRGLFEN